MSDEVLRSCLSVCSAQGEEVDMRPSLSSFFQFEVRMKVNGVKRRGFSRPPQRRFNAKLINPGSGIKKGASEQRYGICTPSQCGWMVQTESVNSVVSAFYMAKARFVYIDAYLQRKSKRTWHFGVMNSLILAQYFWLNSHFAGFICNLLQLSS